MLNDSTGLNVTLFERSEKEPDVVAYVLLDTEGEKINEITNIDLHNKASIVAFKIQQKISNPGNAMLLFRDNINFIPALFGTFYSGSVAIPFAAPNSFDVDGSIDRIITAVNDSNVKVIITTQNIFDQLTELISSNFDLDSVKFVIIDNINFDENIYKKNLVIKNNPLALILFTTGVSGKAKGVVHSHSDLIKHSKRIENNFFLSKESRSLNWIPYHHYLGLFYGIIQPFYSGMIAYVFSEFEHTFDSRIWLTAISKYQISFSGGPSFYYDMCGMQSDNNISEDLDLSNWSVAYISAEIIRSDIVYRFVSKFQYYGFNREAMYPTFGTVEAPLISSGNFIIDEFQFKKDTNNPSFIFNNENYDDNSLINILPSGKKSDGIELCIVDLNTKKLCQDGEVGEIWISDNGDESYLWGKGNRSTIYESYIKNKPDEAFLNTGNYGYKKNEIVFVFGKTENKEYANKEEQESLFISNKFTAQEELVKSPSIIEKEPIAVIGMAGLFPQSDSCEEFWENLENGKDLISEIPENRWDWKEIYGTPDNQSNKTDIKWGGFINDIEAFDASFFNISPKEAQLMDPMQRKLIQVVWQAVEDAGYRMSDYSGKKIGVFVGIGTFDYLQLVLENNHFTHAYASTGIVHCMAANRISYLFNLKGPSESVDTACSSSLVALHRAVSLIRSNECEIAIVCGANILLSSSVYVALSNASMLSKSGKCRTFDESADGYVRGEGIIAIVLKKMSSSITDPDHIYGLIKGTSVNHGGHTNSLTAPNPFAQAEVIKEALKMASIPSDTMSYIETHGTATSLGDPIEINGLISAFNSTTCQSNIAINPKCALGSVKTNIGHLEAAAGIAGITKVLLSMRHKKIPAHLHLNTPNKNINLENSPFYFVGNTASWKPLKDKNGESIPRRAGVSSFGFGGVNSHVVLEEYNATYMGNVLKAESNVFLFSAKSENVLKVYINRYRKFLEKKELTLNLCNMAYTLQIGREPFDFRLAVIASDKNELLKKLTGFVSNKTEVLQENFDSIYYGVVKKDLSNLIFNSDKKNISILEEQYLFDNNLIYLSQLWILGADIEWHKLYCKKESIKRMSLPTYPFEKTHHWISQKTKQKCDITINDNLIKDTYDVNWYEMSLSTSLQKEDKDYILFCDSQGGSDKFNNILTEKGINAYRIYYKDFGKKTDNTYIVNPSDKESYIKIFSEICARSMKKEFYVINFWPLDINTRSEMSSSELIFNYQFVCQTALDQIQMLLPMKEQFKLHLWIVCSNVQSVMGNKINLCCAPLWGMAKTLLLEHSSFFRSIIDINSIEKFNLEKLFEEIIAFSEEGEVVFRNGIRYVSRLVPCEVEVSKNTNININGTYLITGGLGSLGLLVAEWLSSFKVKKILLLSRRGLVTNEKQEIIDLIESRGTEVIIIQADVTNLSQMKSIKNSYIKQNELRGVFHLAGAYKDNLLQNMQFEEFDNIISAKVQGTWVLHQILKECHLDWFVMFSSGASVWGAATGGHYSAANYFLDAYTDYCETNGMTAMSISWGGLWKSSGIIPKDKEDYFKSIGVKQTNSEEGLQQLESIMNSNCRKKVVAPIEWPIFLEVMNAQRERTLFERLNTDSETNDLKNNNIQFIADLSSCASKDEKYKFILNELKQLVKIILSIADKNDIKENVGLFDLGMDSLTYIDLKNKIKELMGIKMTTTTLFDCNTLQLLTDNILINSFHDDDEVEDVNLVGFEQPEINNLSQFDNIEKDELLKYLKSEIDNS